MLNKYQTYSKKILNISQFDIEIPLTIVYN